MPEDIEETLERLGAQNIATCPCPEHMRRKSVAVIHIAFIINKAEDEDEDEDEDDVGNEDEGKKDKENEDPDSPQMEIATGSNADSGIIPDKNTDNVSENEEEPVLQSDEEKPRISGKVHVSITKTIIPKLFGYLISA